MSGCVYCRCAYVSGDCWYMGILLCVWRELYMVDIHMWWVTLYWL